MHVLKVRKLKNCEKKWLKLCSDLNTALRIREENKFQDKIFKSKDKKVSGKKYGTCENTEQCA